MGEALLASAVVAAVQLALQRVLLPLEQVGLLLQGGERGVVCLGDLLELVDLLLVLALLAVKVGDGGLDAGVGEEGGLAEAGDLILEVPVLLGELADLLLVLLRPAGPRIRDLLVVLCLLQLHPQIPDLPVVLLQLFEAALLQLVLGLGLALHVIVAGLKELELGGGVAELALEADNLLALGGGGSPLGGAGSGHGRVHIVVEGGSLSGAKPAILLPELSELLLGVDEPVPQLVRQLAQLVSGQVPLSRRHDGLVRRGVDGAGRELGTSAPAGQLKLTLELRAGLHEAFILLLEALVRPLQLGVPLVQVGDELLVVLVGAAASDHAVAIS
mmetsp:Transcript_14742/g.27241  ORF Transcript_14742/g.27241 Transcript_14742/m.27241 type:complete len:330 (+) Transcript_14742:5723-6712(+)